MHRPGSGSKSKLRLPGAASLCAAAVLFLSLHLSALAGQGRPAFEGERAYSYLERQHEFGPRTPGSAGHDLALEYLSAFFEKRRAHVTRQPFAVQTGDSSIAATNIIARFHSGIAPRVLLCAHWDSRPWADSDPDSTKRGEPVPGANDGGSGVAVLMEVANALAAETPLCGADIVLFDAEDMGGRHGLDYALGSQYYVSMMTVPPAAAILLDMIGDADLDLPVERYSMDTSPELVRAVWESAGRLGLSQFRLEPNKYVYDDHVPLLLAGVPSVDIVDIEYEYWHTVADTPDKCSPASLTAVGTLLLYLLYDGDSPLPSFLEGKSR